MTDMDLIPDEFRRELARQRHRSRFMWASLILVGFLVVARATIGYMTWRDQTQVIALQQRQQALSQSQTEADSLRQQRLITQQQLAALNQLKGRDQVSQFMHSIDDAYLEHIWLDSVRFQRREGTGTPATAEGVPAIARDSAVDTGDLAVLHDAEMTGHASSHSELANFMQRLGAQPAVLNLRLINTETRSYTGVQVIDFRLALQMRSKERP